MSTYDVAVSASVRRGLDLGVIYQVYPRSFADSNADGIGDLNGIIARLDYLTSIGVDTIWLSPIYRSPMHDGGYDVADHCDVDPLFGTLHDADALIEAAHARRLKILLDYVPNHTSDQHPWFESARSARTDPRRTWYIWADPGPDGGPPNNWWNHFDGGPAWTLDERTSQYYLHLFSPQQPDLNWREPTVQAAMFDVLRFWLDRGVDGFRVDVPSHLLKDAALRDEPPGPRWPAALHPPRRTDDLEGIHDLVRRMRDVVDEYPARALVGELWLPPDRLMTYYGDDDEFHVPYNFQLVAQPWDSQTIRSTVDAYEGLLPPGAWPNWVLGNHDRSRVASRLGPAQARVAMMALLTLRGTPTIYYGDELGMTDVPVPAKQRHDREAVPDRSRDEARTPMQWDDSTHAGFCRDDVEPWLPVPSADDRVDASSQELDPFSLRHLTRVLTSLRRDSLDLSIGPYRSFDAPDGVFAFARGEDWTVVLNLTDSAREWVLPDPDEVVVSTYLDRRGEPVHGALHLRHDEGILLRHLPRRLPSYLFGRLVN